ncbi:MAG: DNA (cytosine-5-)-methyltransferase [Dehalococcoidia bacterium]|nr:DNA (cytosine-5-)-methyltransferase [Dehalococcoidia bacterium]
MTLLYGRFDEMVDAVLAPLTPRLRCIDLFSGIGGFHIAATNLGLDVVFACDIDADARIAYQHNFGLVPMGDIVSIKAEDIPDHDILLAGFPCQPFSIIGRQQGLADPRGTLFLEIIRIVQAKRPRGIVLENVKQLSTVRHGGVLRDIMGQLRELGYSVDYRVLNALDFGLPQKRERTIVVATLPAFKDFPWPSETVPMTPLADLLEQNPDRKYFVSETIRAKRHAAHTANVTPAIWHENKAGHISSHQWSCALRAGASHNYLLVDGERRLTPRELLRLQGFPDSFEIVCNDSQTRKQAGNAVPVPVVEAAIKGVVDVLGQSKIARRSLAEKRPIPAGAIS